MQQHNLSGNGDLMSSRSRSRSNDTRTPPHTETSKYSSIDRSEKSQRYSNAVEQLKNLSSKSSNNNNNNSKESSVGIIFYKFFCKVKFCRHNRSINRIHK